MLLSSARIVLCKSLVIGALLLAARATNGESRADGDTGSGLRDAAIAGYVAYDRSIHSIVQEYTTSVAATGDVLQRGRTGFDNKGDWFAKFNVWALGGKAPVLSGKFCCHEGKVRFQDLLRPAGSVGPMQEGERAGVAVLDVVLLRRLGAGNFGRISEMIYAQRSDFTARREPDGLISLHGEIFLDERYFGNLNRPIKLVLDPKLGYAPREFIMYYATIPSPELVIRHFDYVQIDNVWLPTRATRCFYNSPKALDPVHAKQVWARARQLADLPNEPDMTKPLVREQVLQARRRAAAQIEWAEPEAGIGFVQMDTTIESVNQPLPKEDMTVTWPIGTVVGDGFHDATYVQQPDGLELKSRVKYQPVQPGVGDVQEEMS